MTQWLLHQNSPSEMMIEDECELRSPEEDGSIIRCKRHDLTLPEIKNHLDSGKQVIKLALTWENRLSFILDEHLIVKRLKFLDLIQDQMNETQASTFEEQFDADFSIMTAELAQFLPRLLNIFGGENHTSA
jgi:recombination associated protein RdgC